ncbi:hypothetical protein [uncultured Pseudokineococcus sp.]|uniref:hypothetical protein n=1 Tax=uncultured Pseudokineococcus sp. TaxID=1642928 RepID=UPI00262ED54F|nr:hypothetical protein [uncultured Pseudokineococcus sp.]
MRKTTRIGAIVGGIISLTLAAPAVATPARAAVNGLDSNAKAEIGEKLSDFGVGPEKVNDLIDALEAGDAWDSMTMDAEPASATTTTETRHGHRFAATTLTYPDGSVARTERELAAKPAATDASALATGISGCQVTTAASYTYFDNCNIRWENAIAYMDYYADYRMLPGRQGAGFIDDVYNYAYDVTGASRASGSLRIEVPSGNPARAVSTISYTLVETADSGQASVALLVDSGGGRLQY